MELIKFIKKRAVMYQINKAIDKVMDAQAALKYVQSKQTDEEDQEFWTERIEDCMDLTDTMMKRYMSA